MADINTGNFLGGFARGSARERTLALAGRESDRADRKQTFQERLAAQAVESESRLRVITGLNGRLQQTIDLASTTIEQVDAEGAPRTAEITRKLIEPMRESALLIASKAAESGLPFDPDLINRRFDLLASRPTPAAIAKGSAQTEVAGQSARVTALTGQGVPADAARRQAFGLPAPTDSFSILTPDELAANGFAPNAIIQKNATTGEIKTISEGGVLKPGDGVKIEQDMRRDLDKQSQDFEQAQQNFSAMQELAKDGTGASDVALVFSFFKTIDPSSTVREGEFATAAQAAGLPAQFVQSFARLDSGEILPAELRTDLLSAAETFYHQRLTDQRARETFYGNLATRAGVQPGNVVRSRIRGFNSGRFGGMTNGQLNAVDVDNLSDDEIKQLDAELSARGL